VSLGPRPAAGRRRPASAALGLALLLAAGCAPRLRPPPPDLPLDPAALLAEVRATQARVQTVQGEARVVIEGPQGSGGVDQFLAAERPGRLRVESHDFFGNVLSLLVVDGPTLALYDAKARILYRGAATAANVARLVPVALAPAELVTLLCGSAPVLDGEPLDASPVDGALRLTLKRGDEVQRLDVGAGAAVLRARESRLGRVSREVELTGHRPLGGASLPTQVVARAPLERITLTLRWRAVEVNQPLEPSLFQLATPDGARVVDLDPAAR
jgi:outer membrane lipoprotein-sorting protein